MLRRCSLLVAIACATIVVSAQAPKAPVLVMLVSTIDDHLHDGMSAERIVRTLPVIDALRREHPQAHVSWLVRVSGAMSGVLGDTDYATHLVERLKAHVADGSVEIGYDGTEEPTFLARPRPNLRGLVTPEARWLARLDTTEWFLTEARHPVLGDPLPTGSGGLARTLEVFGRVSAARGITFELGSDAEVVHALGRLGVAPLLPGLPDVATYPARTLDGVRTGTGPLSREFAPGPTDSPELFFLGGVLRLSDYTGIGSRVVIAREGVEPLRKYLESLDRAQPRVVQVLVGHPGVYAKLPYGPRAYETPLEYAYDKPRAPRLPDDALRSPDERAAEYDRERAVLEWLAGQFLPANPGSRFTSVAHLQELAGNASNVDLPRATLGEAADILHQHVRVNGGLPPTFVRTAARDLSLAETFLALAAALAQTSPGGSVPDVVRLSPIGGPLFVATGAPPHVGESLDVASVLDTCRVLSKTLVSQTWTRVPTNVVPHEIAVGALTLTPAQFLAVMADTYRDHHVGRRVAVPAALMLSPVAEAVPRTRPVTDVGIVWTLKPARLALKAPTS